MTTNTPNVLVFDNLRTERSYRLDVTICDGAYAPALSPALVWMLAGDLGRILRSVLPQVEIEIYVDHNDARTHPECERSLT